MPINYAPEQGSFVFGTVTADQGVPNTVPNAWPIKVTDGIETAAVKPGATSPVIADPALVVTLSPNSPFAPVPIISDTSATGNLDALNAAVTVAMAGQRSASFNLAAGTLIGTIVAEESYDGGITFVPTFFENESSTFVSSIVFAANNGLVNRTLFVRGGATHLRVRVSAYTSGTAVAILKATQAQPGTITSTPNDGCKATYSAAVLGLATAAAATDIFTITGAAGVLTRITSLVIYGTRTAASAIDIQIIKRSTANAGGTSAIQTNVPHDSNDGAAASVVRSYTVNPALGTTIGAVRTAKMFVGSNSVQGQSVIFDFGRKQGTSLMLRSASEVLAVNLNGTTVAGSSFDIYAEWTEEPL